MEHRGEVLSAWFPALRSRMARIPFDLATGDIAILTGQNVKGDNGGDSGRQYGQERSRHLGI
jgi:hypothetical protein